MVRLSVALGGVALLTWVCVGDDARAPAAVEVDGEAAPPRAAEFVREHAEQVAPQRADTARVARDAAQPVRAFVRDPALEQKAQRAKQLGEAAVLSAARRAELHALYADEALMARQRERLLRSDPKVDRQPPRDDRVASFTFAEVNGSLPAEGEAERMDAIRYLSEAVRWKQNPARDVVVEEIERILLEDSIDERLHPGIRRGMLGDKIELFSIYVREFPTQGDALLAQATTARVDKTLRMARASLDAGYTFDGVGRPRDPVASRTR